MFRYLSADASDIMATLRVLQRHVLLGQRHLPLKVGILIGSTSIAARTSFEDHDVTRLRNVHLLAAKAEKPTNLKKKKMALWRELRHRMKVVARVSQLTLLTTPLAVSGALIYTWQRCVRSTQLEDAWWALALRFVESAGPTFIKLCQWAATRNDLFPAAMTKRFAKLHDSVAPHGIEHTKQTLEDAFGEDWSTKLHISSSGVLGSGCIAQVYKGTATIQGQQRDVAVKVVHPRVRDLVEIDMLLLRSFGSFLETMVPSLKYLGVQQAIHNFEFLMERQLDLRHEARNLQRLAFLFRNDPTVFIPKPVNLDVQQRRDDSDEDPIVVVPEERQKRGALVRRTLRDKSDDDPTGSTRDVLVEEYVEGQPIAEFVGKENDVTSLLAHRGATALLRMVLQYNFVHGDLHPGNVLVTKDLKIVLLDAGICIELPQNAHDNMVALLRAMLECRGRDAAKLMLDDASEVEHVRDRGQEEDFITGIADLVEHARHQTFFESVGQYYTDICNLAIQNRVALDASFISVALAVKVVEGLVMDLQPNFPILEIALPMFLKAHFTHSSTEKLTKLSEYSKNILRSQFRDSILARSEFRDDL